MYYIYTHNFGTDLEALKTRIDHLKPRSTGDVVAGLTQLSSLQTEDILNKPPFTITTMALDAALRPSSVRAGLRMPGEQASSYCTLTDPSGLSVLVPHRLYNIIAFIIK